MDKHFDSLMSSKQKTLAAIFMVLAVGLVLYLIAPIITVILKSLIFTGIFVVIVGFLIWNWNILWMYFKLLSWKTTKAAISLDKMGVLKQSLEIAYRKQKSVDSQYLNIKSIHVETERRLIDLTKRHDNNRREAMALQSMLESQTNPADIARHKSALDLALHKVKTDKDSLDNLIPRSNYIENGVKQMAEIREVLQHKVKRMEYTVEAKTEEYETLKELNKASNTLKDFMNDNNEDAKIFNEGLRQTEESISSFIANIENLDKDIQPLLLTMQSQKLSDIEAGRKLLDDYKKTLEDATI